MPLFVYRRRDVILESCLSVCLFCFCFFPCCLASLPQTWGGMTQLYMLDISRSTVLWCLWLSGNISLYIFVYYLTLEFFWGHEVECSMEHIHKQRPLVTLADIQCFIHKSKYTSHFLVQTKICITRIRYIYYYYIYVFFVVCVISFLWISWIALW